MIHHLSISAHDPARVAAVVAELIGGKAYPFPSARGSHIAICDDGHATLVEVYPLGTVMLPGEDGQDVQFQYDADRPDYVPTHAALSVALDEASIKAIAAREGWRALTCDRGGIFQVVEVWLENRVLFELLTAEMAAAYLQAVTTRNWESFLAQNGGNG
ncbi:hypothetical protein A1507_00610 [Methylomonas koyamae]|uniref:VOC domain-containing protein n=1 Tax=Methylomonas koyamae TaxID=702114 RepID=A0A177NH63_9GAMM|nr:hypothetical protein [Methylomonas koyamae]OAI16400.1 hypothetical protein A1507_00610 [Methylomonas koyamae]